MKIETIKNPLLNEECVHIVHDSGLNIYCMPKKGYSGAYALFGTNYGSIDTKIKTADGIADVPEGTAHFLEHKLFESEELDAFERFAKTGASANAYTSFDSTCYVFSCVGDFNASLRILLDFVQSPFFSEETVAKEQGIIGQEITMYKDYADWEVEFNLLRALYHVHPVRIDIAGTKESIAQITAQTLYDCYSNFYNLHNMCLAVAGNIDVDEVIKICDECLKPSGPFDFVRTPPAEPKGIVKDYTEESLSVGAPIFALGFKEQLGLPKRDLKTIIATDILLSVIAGSTSDFYNELISQGLINANFGFEQINGFGYGVSMFSGESSDPNEVARRIKERIRSLKENGIDPEEFEYVRRKQYGHTIMDYNDIDAIAGSLVTGHFTNSPVFEDVEIYRSITLADVTEVLNASLNEEYSALSVITPVDKR